MRRRRRKTNVNKISTFFFVLNFTPLTFSRNETLFDLGSAGHRLRRHLITGDDQLDGGGSVGRLITLLRGRGGLLRYRLGDANVLHDLVLLVEVVALLSWEDLLGGL